MLKEYNLYIDTKKTIAEVVRGAKQGDNNLKLNITLTQNSKPIDLTNTNVRINYRRSDCKVLLQKVDIVNPKEGKVSVNVLTSVLECAGMVISDLSIFDKDDRKITSATFKIMVETGVYTADYIDKDDLDIIQDIQNKEEDRIEKELERQKNELDRIKQESDRQDKEQERQKNELERISNEDNRKKEENTRVEHESERIKQENIRVKQESDRQSKESDRVKQETVRGKNEDTRLKNELDRQKNEESRKQTQLNMDKVITDINKVEEYDNSKAYNKLNRVVFNGSCYECIKDSKGNMPTNEEYWICIAQRGKDGDGAGDMLKSIYDKNDDGIVDISNNALHLNGIPSKDYVLGEQMTQYVKDAFKNELLGTVKVPRMIEYESVDNIKEQGLYMCYDCEDAPDEDIYIMLSQPDLYYETYDSQIVMSIRNEPGAMYIRVGEHGQWEDWVAIHQKENEGIIRKTYAELSELKANKQLVAGKQYLLTDYATKYIQPTTNVLKEMEIEPLLLTATSENTFAPIAYSPKYPQDIIHYDFNNNKCEDKSTPRNGFITYREDTINNNKCPQDFRTMLWARYKPDSKQYYRDGVLTNYEVWTSGKAKMGVIYKAGNELLVAKVDYTPSSQTDSNVFDTIYKDITVALLTNDKTRVLSNSKEKLELKRGSLHERFTFGKSCRNNNLGECSVLHNNVLGDTCSNNIFGNNCIGNTFGDIGYENTLGGSSKNNIFIGNSGGNSFGNDCSDNYMGNGFYYNSFGNDCSSSRIGTSCKGNKLDNGCLHIELGDGCVYNSFGNDCSKINIGANSKGNDFGNNCASTSLGNGCSRNSFGNYCHSIILGKNNNNNSFSNYCYNNTLGEICAYNHFNNGCNNNKLGKSCDNNFFVKSIRNTFNNGAISLIVKQLMNKDVSSISKLHGVTNGTVTIDGLSDGTYAYYYTDSTLTTKWNKIP